MDQWNIPGSLMAPSSWPADGQTDTGHLTRLSCLLLAIMVNDHAHKTKQLSFEAEFPLLNMS